MTDRPPARCPKCGEEAEPGFAVCWKCQTRLPASARNAKDRPKQKRTKNALAAGTAASCPRCGKEVAPDDDECRNCETPLAVAAPRSTRDQSTPVGPALGSTKHESARPPKRIQILIGSILVVLYMALLVDSAARGDPRIGDFAGGGMMLLGGPGSLLIYFGLRTRFKHRERDLLTVMLTVTSASVRWMLPGFVALVASFLLGGGWKWGLSAAIVGLALVFVFSTVEGKVAERAWHNDPNVQRTYDLELNRISGERQMANLSLLIRRKDIDGLRRAFTLSSDWQSREWTLDALGVLYKELRDGHSDRADEMIPVLTDILTLCRAERTGGSHRENCIEHAEMLLRSG